MIIERIDAANLNAAVYRTARRLLDVTNAVTGSAELDRDDLRRVCNTRSDNTARSHLIELQSAGLLTYHRNSTVRVFWFDWLPDNVIGSDDQCAPVRGSVGSAINSRGSDGATNTTAHSDVRDGVGGTINSRVTPSKRALHHHLPHTHADAHSGWMDGSNQSTDRVNQSIPAAPDPTSLALLKAVRVRDTEARVLAAAHPLDAIRACVGAWWLNRKATGGKLQNDPGIVVHWLRECNGVPPNAYDAQAWRRSDLYRQHRRPEEIAAERLAEEEAAERLAMMDQPPAPEPRRELDPELSPYLDSDPVWIALVKADQVGELAGLVRIDTQDGVPLYVLAALDPLRVQWLNSRMATRLRQNIAITVHHPVLVEIVPPVAAGG